MVYIQIMPKIYLIDSSHQGAHVMPSAFTSRVNGSNKDGNETGEKLHRVRLPYNFVQDDGWGGERSIMCRTVSTKPFVGK